MGADVSVPNSARTDLGFRSVQPRGFNVEKRTGRDSPFLPHFAYRIVPFQEFIVLLWADAESRYVGFNFNFNHMRGPHTL